MKDYMNRVILVVTEKELTDGSFTYDIDVPEYEIHIPTIAMNSTEALNMAFDIADALHKTTGNTFKTTWKYVKG